MNPSAQYAIARFKVYPAAKGFSDQLVKRVVAADIYGVKDHAVIGAQRAAMDGAGRIEQFG